MLVRKDREEERKKGAHAFEAGSGAGVLAEIKRLQARVVFLRQDRRSQSSLLQRKKKGTLLTSASAIATKHGTSSLFSLKLSTLSVLFRFRTCAIYVIPIYSKPNPISATHKTTRTKVD